MVLIQRGSYQDALCILYPLVHVRIRRDFQVLKYPYRQVTHHVNHGGSLMIKYVDAREFTLYKVFFSLHKA